jgi:glycosyltransferase involved in cell wall biosynthesis
MLRRDGQNKSREKIKICYVLPFLDPKTDTHYFHIYELIEDISKRADIYLIIEKQANIDKGIFQNCKKIYVQKHAFLPFRFFELLFQLRKAKKEGYNNFYIHYSYIGAITAGIVSKLSNVRCFYWNCGMMWMFESDKTKSFEDFFHYFSTAIPLKISLKMVDYLVTGTNSLKKGYSKNYNMPLNKIKVMPNWVNLDRFNGNIEQKKIRVLRSRLKIGKKRVVLFVHRLVERKGADFIPEIARKFRDKGINDVVFVVAGDGPYKEILEKIIQDESLSNVLLLGRTPNESIPLLMSMSSVLMMPSREEGFPRVLIESMAMGLPYVASNIGGVSEISPKSEKPYLCNVGDIEEFSHKMEKLINNPRRLRILSEELKIYSKNFSKENIEGTFLSLFNN